MRLIPPDTARADEVFANGTDPSFFRYIDAVPFRSRAEAAEFLTTLARENAAGSRRYFLIEHDGCVIGTIGLIFTWHARHKTAEIGYGIAPRWQGRGLFQAACTLLVAEARGQGLKKLVAITRADNKPSCRAVERAGFALEGLVSSFYETSEGRKAAAVYGLAL